MTMDIPPPGRADYYLSPRQGAAVGTVNRPLHGCPHGCVHVHYSAHNRSWGKGACMLDLTSIAVVDNHCHPVLLNQHLDALSFRGYCTEATDASFAEQHV